MSYLFYTPAAGLSEQALAEFRQQGFEPVEVTKLPGGAFGDRLANQNRRRKINLTPEMLRAAVQSGMAVKSVAAEAGCSAPTVRARAAEWGIDLGVRRRPRVEISADDLRRLLDEGKSVADIAFEFKCHPLSVYRRASEHGIPLRARPGLPGGQATADAEVRNIKREREEQRNEYIRRRHAEGATLTEVGNELGITRERVRQLAARIGLVFSIAERKQAELATRKCAVCDGPIPPARGSRTCSEQCKRMKMRQTHLRMAGPAIQSITPEVEDEILRLRREGKSTGFISGAVKASIPTINIVLTRNGMAERLDAWKTPLRQRQVQALRERRAKALAMHDAGQSEQEIADALEISACSVRSDIRRARAEREAAQTS